MMAILNGSYGSSADILLQVTRPSAYTVLGNRSHRSSTGAHLYRAGAIEIREQDERKRKNNEYEDSYFEYSVWQLSVL
jgi:hypothetical protein